MNKSELMDMADAYQTKADKQFRNYQETGITRYEREYRKNDDLATALRMAANAADEHNELLHLRSTLSMIAAEAQRAEHAENREKAMESVCKSLVSTARLKGLIR